MRTTSASIAASYDAATAGLATGPAVFEVPGDLGPAWTPPPSSGPVYDEAGRSAAVNRRVRRPLGAGHRRAVLRPLPCRRQRLLRRSRLHLPRRSRRRPRRLPRRSSRPPRRRPWRHRRQCLRLATWEADCPARRGDLAGSDSSSPTRSAACWTQPTMRCPIRSRSTNRPNSTRLRSTTRRPTWVTSPTRMRPTTQSLTRTKSRPPGSTILL